VVQICPQTNARWWLSKYLNNELTNFAEIWFGDAAWLSRPQNGGGCQFEKLKNRDLKNHLTDFNKI